MNEKLRCPQCDAPLTSPSVGGLCANCSSAIVPKPSWPERARSWSGRRLVLLSLAVVSLGLLAVYVVWSDARKMEAQKAAAALRDTERAGQTNARLHSLLVNMLRDQLEGHWLISERRMMSITSGQLAALAGLPITQATNQPSVQHYSVGILVGENPGSGWHQSASLLAHLQQLLTKQRQHPVLIDLKIFKFEEDYRQALRTNGVVPMPFQ